MAFTSLSEYKITALILHYCTMLSTLYQAIKTMH
jgi:hypothetical protein